MQKKQNHSISVMDHAAFFLFLFGWFLSMVGDGTTTSVVNDTIPFCFLWDFNPQSISEMESSGRIQWS